MQTHTQVHMLAQLWPCHFATCCIQFPAVHLELSAVYSKDGTRPEQLSDPKQFCVADSLVQFSQQSPFTRKLCHEWAHCPFDIYSSSAPCFSSPSVLLNLLPPGSSSGAWLFSLHGSGDRRHIRHLLILSLSNCSLLVCRKRLVAACPLSLARYALLRKLVGAGGSVLHAMCSGCSLCLRPGLNAVLQSMVSACSKR